MLAAAALLLHLWQLGQVALRDWDEGTIAGVARAMLHGGSWLYPTLYGEPYWNKPPLVEWLMATAFSLGGVSEWTARLLPAAVSAIAVPLLYAVGRDLFDRRSTAHWSAGVYLTLLPVARHGRLAMRDGVAITLFLLLLWCVLKARRERRWALGAGLALGGLILTKGILALLLGGIVGLFLIANRQGSLLLSPAAWRGLLLGTLPAFAWYGAQLQRYGSQFWQAHFLSQSFDRVWSTVENNQGPPGYYLVELLKYGWPWLAFWPGGLWLAWRYRRQPWGQLVLMGTVIYLGSISIMGTKLPWYVLPLYPFIALAAGAQIDRYWRGDRIPSWLAGLLGLIGGAALMGGSYLGWSEGKPRLVAIALTLGLTLGLTAFSALRQKRRFAISLTAGLYLTLLLLMSSDLWLWELNEAYPVKPVAALVRSRVPSDAEIYTTFPYERPSLNFYSGRRIMAIQPAQLPQLWQPDIYFLIEQPNPNLPPHAALGSASELTLIRPGD
ncbi:MAG: glycosyltransferase family 39 protein [Leptolyngbya sp. SIO4C1]|nr:glycosyltransferase family 39 protein [Leptolyngbya sp. SIO4C1]